MDKEQAKLILASYTPAIGNDHQDFTEALALAAENRELGEWLARERAMDEAFTTALATIAMPDGLRDDILGCLHGEFHGTPDASDRDDAAMIGALASVPVPANLRGRILTAMEQSAPKAATGNSKVVSFWRRFSIPLAAAAGIALALIVTRPADTPQLQAKHQRVPIDLVPVSFIQSYESPFFRLEVKKDNRQELVETLKSRSLPCPCCLPPGIESLKSIGCRELDINGIHGSLICFEQNEFGAVHLVIFRRADVDGSCSNAIDDPCYFSRDQWAVARWQNEDNVFFLIGKTGVEQLKKLF